MKTTTKKPAYPKWNNDPKLRAFIRAFEQSHFRTVDDTGANPIAMNLWNMVRYRVGLPMIDIDDLPKWNVEARAYVLPKGSKLLGKPVS